MQLTGEVTGRMAAFGAQRTVGRPARAMRVLNATEVSTVTSSAPARASGKKEKIYIGHAKDDYEGRRLGTQGRFIEDDPSKYPSKEDVGFISGATGGWAGGEVALKKMMEQYDSGAAKPAKAAPKASKTVTVPATGKAAPLKAEKGKDLIYVGFGKDDLDARKSGAPGAFIKDDARKYPSKESIGPLANVVGGFVGGELGVKQFASEGDVEILPEGARSRQRQSPLVIGIVVALVGTVGGLSLESLTDFTADLAKNGGQLSGLDDNTKLLLEAAVITLGVAAGLAGTRAALKAMTDSVARNAVNLAKLTVFWVVVFLAARFVLES